MLWCSIVVVLALLPLVIFAWMSWLSGEEIYIQIKDEEEGRWFEPISPRKDCWLRERERRLSFSRSPFLSFFLSFEGLFREHLTWFLTDHLRRIFLVDTIESLSSKNHRHDSNPCSRSGLLEVGFVKLRTSITCTVSASVSEKWFFSLIIFQTPPDCVVCLS